MLILRVSSVCVFFLVFFFFFKQKTAYEMRISDWSSDVCSSDLARPRHADVIFDIVVPGREVVVADRPVDPDILALVRLEVLRRPAKAPAPPEDRKSVV